MRYETKTVMDLKFGPLTEHTVWNDIGIVAQLKLHLNLCRPIQCVSEKKKSIKQKNTESKNATLFFAHNNCTMEIYQLPLH